MKRFHLFLYFKKFYYQNNFGTIENIYFYIEGLSTDSVVEC